MILVGSAVLSAIFGAALGILLDRRSQGRVLVREQRSRERRINELAILDAQPGEALTCVVCHHPVGWHKRERLATSRPCNTLYCECGLSREDAAKITKEAIAGELYVSRFGPPLELDSGTLLDMRKKLDDH